LCALNTSHSCAALPLHPVPLLCRVSSMVGASYKLQLSSLLPAGPVRDSQSCGPLPLSAGNKSPLSAGPKPSSVLGPNTPQCWAPLSCISSVVAAFFCTPTAGAQLFSHLPAASLGDSPQKVVTFVRLSFKVVFVPMDLAFTTVIFHSFLCLWAGIANCRAICVPSVWLSTEGLGVPINLDGRVSLASLFFL
jgi:hypothetical protein